MPRMRDSGKKYIIMHAIIMARKLPNAIFSNQLSLSTLFRCLFVVTFQNIDQTLEQGRVVGDGDVNIVNRADI